MNRQRELLKRSLDIIKLFAPGYGLLIEEIEAELANPEQEQTLFANLFTEDKK